MAEPTIRFDDGASYEQMMGRWSALVGDAFLDWLAVPPGARWLDVGCGNGAFTARVVERCAPAAVHAIDPSPGQLAYARTRLPAGAPVVWTEADAMTLPIAEAQVDVAVMALVLFFVPQPALGVSEMVRAVKPGGVVAAYHWDILGHGFPFAAIGQSVKAAGGSPQLPPSVAASTLEASEALWLEAGLEAVKVTSFTVQREFQSFDEYWDSAASSNTLRPMFTDFDAQGISALREATRKRLGDTGGRLSVSARANAVRGVRPAG
jgi:SAM-dependent methyltransferase